MGVMDAIKRGFTGAAKSLGLVLVLFIFNALSNLGSIPFAQAPGATPPPPVAAGAVIFSIVFMLASIFIQGGSLGLVRDYLKEGKMKLAGMAGYGFKYYLRLLGLGILIILIIAIVALIAGVVIAATTPLNNTVVTVLATIIAITIGAIGLYFVLLLTMSPYSLVCDEVGIIEAMKRSMTTVKKNIGKVLLLLVLLVLIALGIGFVVGFLTGIITVAMPLVAGQVVIGLVNAAINGYVGVVMIVSFMSFYLALTGKEKAAV